MLSGSQQIDFDKVRGTLEDFSLFLFVRFLALARKFVRRASHLDYRNDMLSRLTIEDGNVRFMEFQRWNMHLDSLVGVSQSNTRRSGLLLLSQPHIWNNLAIRSLDKHSFFYRSDIPVPEQRLQVIS